MKYRLERGGESSDIDVQRTPEGFVLRDEGSEPQAFRVTMRDDGSQLVVTPWGELILHAARRGAEVWAEVDGRRLSARAVRVRPSALGSGNGPAAGEVRAPMAGKLLRLSVALGDLVQASQPVAVIEAMKMENELLAPLSGVVVELFATAPSTVDKGALIVRLEPR